MASRRATASLTQAVIGPSARRTAISARAPAAAELPLLRQYHSHSRPSTALCAVRTSSPLFRTAPTPLAARRAYSTDSAEKPSKVWDFEALQKLTSTPNPSVTIIDVREPHELQESGRIPGALNIPVSSAPDSFHITADEFEDRFGYPRPAPDAEVVFYCRAGVRSRAAAGLARDAGWTKVGEYPGSWLDWFEKGGKVER